MSPEHPNRVQARRIELGIRIVDLAAAIGRSQGFVSMVEGGFSRLAPARMVQIADALQTTPDKLWPEKFDG